MFQNLINLICRSYLIKKSILSKCPMLQFMKYFLKNGTD
jgi:hypothetical protein